MSKSDTPLMQSAHTRVRNFTMSFKLLVACARFSLAHVYVLHKFVASYFLEYNSNNVRTMITHA